ncbi:MAG: hypothetical protein ACOYL6_17180 [Bacteriovoracaceae bacterium]
MLKTMILASLVISSVAQANTLACQPIALHQAIEAANLNLGKALYKEGYIDDSKTTGKMEVFRVVLNDGTDYPDASDAFVITLDPARRCAFVKGYNAYTGESL